MRPLLLPKNVQHGDAYQKAMQGLHGQQLKLALLEGEGKDDPDFDPFLEEELEEARLIAEELERKNGTAEAAGDKEEKDDEEEDDEEEEDSEEEDSDDNDEDDIDTNRQSIDRARYNNDGSLKRNKSETAILRAGAPAGGTVAVIALAGSQHKVTTDDILIVNRLKPTSTYAVGSVHTLQDVLLVSSSALTLVGMPTVQGANVDVMVEEITRDQKVVIFKRRRRKHSKRKTGFRRDVTMLRVLDIRFPEPYGTHEHTERPEPAELVHHRRATGIYPASTSSGLAD
jgi:large subunit ribosomal protein L21